MTTLVRPTRISAANYAVPIEKYNELWCLLDCVERNLSKGMSKSMQKLQARTIREVMKEAGK